MFNSSMCVRTVAGITRFGVASLKESTLMLASFERTVDIICEAAIHRDIDKCEGVSERIIMGQPMSIGTGMFAIFEHDDTPPETPPRKNRQAYVENQFNFYNFWCNFFLHFLARISYAKIFFYDFGANFMCKNFVYLLHLDRHLLRI